MTRALLIMHLVFGAALIPMGAKGVRIGDNAPLFTAPSDKDEVNLESYPGWSIGPAGTLDLSPVLEQSSMI